jgi:hypothetical protein
LVILAILAMACLDTTTDSLAAGEAAAGMVEIEAGTAEDTFTTQVITDTAMGGVGSPGATIRGG